MSTAANDEFDTYRPGLEAWFDSSLGSILLEREEAWLAERLETTFGYYLLQLSALVGKDLAGVCSIRHRFQLASSEDAPGRSGAVARFEALPLASGSVDVVILHHVLEFSQQPHQILREAYRVLMPRGQLLVLCINPWSLFGMRTRALAQLRGSPWQGHMIGSGRMLDWMSLLDLRVCKVQQAFHHLPLPAPRLLGRLDGVWRNAERYSLPGGGVYMIEARKQVASVTPLKLKPRWSVWRPEIAPLGAANTSWYTPKH